MEDAIMRARLRLEHEERSSWARRLEQAVLAVSDVSPVRIPAAGPDPRRLLHPVLLIDCAASILQLCLQT